MKMKKVVRIFGILVLAAITVFLIFQYRKTAAEVNSLSGNLRMVPLHYYAKARQQGKLEYLHYTTKDYNGDLSSMEKYAVVYIPYGYDGSSPCDILYLMHGHGGSAATWLGTPEEPKASKNMLDHMIEDEVTKPLIVVCATYYDHNEDEHTGNYDVYLTDPFGSELRQDLIPAAESRYHTFAGSTDEEGLRRSREHRLFGGFSMGGVTAWYRFLDSMDYFSWFLPFSGSLYWGAEARTGTEGIDTERLAAAARDQGYRKEDFYIYTAVGSLDFAIGPLERQIGDMLQYPSDFVFGKTEEEGTNVTFGVGRLELHTGHGRERSLYNALSDIYRYRMK